MILDYYLPNNTITNQQLAQDFPEWDYENFEKRVGIKQRHIVAPNETALDLGEQAALKVIEKETKKEIDFVFFCTQSPDYFLPTSACILQNRLGLSKNCGALDYNLGCSGYVYGLAVAKGLLSAGIAKNLLLVVAETYSKHIHPKDRTNRAIFGDGAAATLLSSEDANNLIGDFVLGTDGSGFKELIVKNGGFRNLNTSEAELYEYGSGNYTSDSNLYMNGPEIFNFSIETVPPLVKDTAQKNGLKLEEVDYFIFHQANQYMLNFLRKKLKIEKEKFCIDLEDAGNTVSATIPIALKNALVSDKIKTGDKVMLVGFGVGLSWGATVITI